MRQETMTTPPPTSSAVQNIFAEVPITYDLVNHVMTLGLDVLWRRRAARIAESAEPGQWVDMCTGTGDMAISLSRLAPEGTTITAVDFCPEMMAQARTKPGAGDIDFVTADVKDLPFPDDSIDLITISFATRNINLSREVLIRSFSEFYRVLKPGGRFVNLETSQPRLSFVRKCFHLYVKLFATQIGARISRSRVGYAYLGATIPRFYPAEELADIMRQAGFDEVTFQRLLLGAAAIHQAKKL